ncbi:Rft protein-domain-containing protein [Lentinula raphanica]|nr:Rft protein-domain-containing protein [Lentinula raphanica]
MSSAMSTLTSLMGLQLFTRLFTFILNQALSRLASPVAYGIAAIQFELMLSTILFLSREGVRGALLRVKTGSDASVGSSDQKQGVDAAMNVRFVPIIIGVPFAFATSSLYVAFAGTEILSQAHFRSAVAVYVAAAVMELLAEPMHNMAMVNLKTHLRVRAEGVSITAKTLTTFFVLVYDASRGHGDLALLAFAFGQLSYGASLFFMYLREYREAVWPKTLSGESVLNSVLRTYFDRDMLALSMTMTSQSLVKHFLTEGDKLILSWFSPLQDQGGYALAVNYGSLIVRIVFQPIEETMRLYFSRTLADVTTAPVSSSTSKNEKNTHQPVLKQAADTLMTLLRMQAIGSLFVLIFGPAYISLLLNVLLPPKYLSTSAPRVLEAWIWYLPVLAVNGGLEAFLASVALPQDVNKQSRWMILFTMIYITSAIALYRFELGDTALIYANIINLSARIIYTARFVQGFFARHRASGFIKWWDVLPPWNLVVPFMISLLIVHSSETVFGATAVVQRDGRMGILRRPVLLHIAVGGVLALCCLALWAWNSRSQFRIYKSKTT